MLLEHEMNNLIEKLHQAKGPSRELDEEIFEFLYPKEPELTEEEIAIRMGQYGFIIHNCRFGPTPEYTASMEIAKTLVLSGHEFSVGIDLENNEGWAKVGKDIWDECYIDIITVATTPALALCIAALEVRVNE